MARFTYEYARPALTVDIVVFGYHEEALSVLLIERGLDPYKGKWALPGGFVHIDETVGQAALRELQEETGITRVYLEELQTFSAVDRDPRERVVSVAHFALVRRSNYELVAGSDAAAAQWFSIDGLPALAFDHKKIIQRATERLADRAKRSPLGFELLEKKFTLSQLQKLYEAVLGRELDKRNFRKKILSLGILIDTGAKTTNVPHRQAALYRFDEAEFKRLQASGLLFDV